MKNRYQQQLKLREIGLQGQEKLQAARVLCIGAGGIGVTLLPYLAGAGVGQIGMVDDDRIELSNLHRQILYREEQIGQFKVDIAKQQLEALNPTIEVQAYATRLAADNAEELINKYDIIADCTDNFYTRYLIHDTCFRLQKPYVYASAALFQGHCSLFYGEDNPCLHCLFPAVPKNAGSCQDSGVLGTVPGLLGLIQATEIIKWITKTGTSLHNRLLCIDFLTMEMKNVRLMKNQECPFCVHGVTLALQDFGSCASSYAITTDGLASFLLQHPKTLLVDVRTREEHAVENIGGIVIPLDELALRVNELDFENTILVYCYSGKRSQQALVLLKELGFKDVYHLDGGFN